MSIELHPKDLPQKGEVKKINEYHNKVEFCLIPHTQSYLWSKKAVSLSVPNNATHGRSRDD